MWLRGCVLKSTSNSVKTEPVWRQSGGRPPPASGPSLVPQERHLFVWSQVAPHWAGWSDFIHLYQLKCQLHNVVVLFFILKSFFHTIYFDHVFPSPDSFQILLTSLPFKLIYLWFSWSFFFKKKKDKNTKIKIKTKNQISKNETKAHKEAWKVFVCLFWPTTSGHGWQITPEFPGMRLQLSLPDFQLCSYVILTRPEMPPFLMFPIVSTVTR